jgi:hypothetical protein
MTTLASIVVFFIALACVAPACAAAHGTSSKVIVTTVASGVSSITEGGAPIRVHIRFTSEPAAPVDLLFLSDGQVAADLPQRTMFPNQWGLGIDVNVSAIADGLLEGPHRGALQISTRSIDDDFDGEIVAPIEFDITDADQAGVVVTPAALQIGEGGSPGTLNVRLAAQPAANVDVQLHADPAQFTLDATTLHFTPGDWNQTQAVHASAVDDFEHELASTSTSMTITTSSTSSIYDRLSVTPTPITVYDDDPANVDIVAPSIIQLDEARSGATAELAIRLTSKPTSAVTVTVSELAGQLKLTNAALTFTPANWNTTQRVTVAAVDDAIVEPRPHVATIALQVRSADTFYDAMRLASRSVQIQDDDAAGVQLEGVRSWPGTVTPGATAPAVRLDEAGATTRVRILLASAPERDVVIHPIATPGTQLAISPSSITVRAGQSLGAAGAVFDVSAVDDHVDEPDVHHASISWTLDTTDSAYAGITTIQSAIDIGDDDTAGVVLTPSGSFDTIEGGAQRDVALTLASAPTSAVVITLLPDAQATAVGATRTLRFDAQNWNLPQHIAVAALNDDVTEPSPHAGLVAFDVASADVLYNDKAVTPITLSIRDNDQPGVVVAPTGADTRVTEAGLTDIVDVHLTSRPSVPVTVTLSEASGQLHFPTASVTIDPQSWKVEHLVEIAALQDSILEGTRVVHAQAKAQSADPAYGSNSATATIVPVDVTIVDDEQPGIILVQSDGDTGVGESGATDTYSIALAAQPTADVTITVQPDGQVKVAPPTLTFTPATWKAAQDVTVSAVQDAVDEAEPHTGMIHHSVKTSAAGWDVTAPLADLGVRVGDDDASSIKFEATGGSTRVVEGGATDTVTMVLTSRPTAPVEIVARPDDQVTVQGSLVFTPDDWGTPRTLTIRAIDDEGVTGERTAMISFSVRSTDLAYKVQAIPALSVTVVDNDVANKDEDGSDEDEDEYGVDPDETDTPDREARGTNQPAAGGASGVAATSSSPSAPRAQASASALRAGDTGQVVAGVAQGVSRVATAAAVPAASNLAAQHARANSKPGHGSGNGSSIGPWLRKHATVVAVVGALLTITGIGGGWVALCNPTRAARRAGRGLRSDRLQP